MKWSGVLLWSNFYKSRGCLQSLSYRYVYETATVHTIFFLAVIFDSFGAGYLRSLFLFCPHFWIASALKICSFMWVSVLSQECLLLNTDIFVAISISIYHEDDMEYSQFQYAICFDWRDKTLWSVFFSQNPLMLCVILATFTVSLTQYLLLKKSMPYPWSWCIFSIIGWSLARNCYLGTWIYTSHWRTIIWSCFIINVILIYRVAYS